MNNKFMFILVGVLVLIPTVSALPIENLTAINESTSITFTWDYNETSQAQIYIDGIYVNTTSLDYYVLSGLEPQESHTLALINTSNSSDIYATQTARTFYSPVIFYIVLIFALILVVLMFFIDDELLTLIIGVLTFVIGVLGFYLAFGFGYTAFGYLMIICAVLALLWCILAGVSLITEKNDMF